MADACLPVRVSSASNCARRLQANQATLVLSFVVPEGAVHAAGASAVFSFAAVGSDGVQADALCALTACSYNASTRQVNATLCTAVTYKLGYSSPTSTVSSASFLRSPLVIGVTSGVAVTIGIAALLAVHIYRKRRHSRAQVVQVEFMKGWEGNGGGNGGDQASAGDPQGPNAAQGHRRRSHVPKQLQYGSVFEATAFEDEPYFFVPKIAAPKLARTPTARSSPAPQPPVTGHWVLKSPEAKASRSTVSRRMNAPVPPDKLPSTAVVPFLPSRRSVSPPRRAQMSPARVRNGEHQPTPSTVVARKLKGFAMSVNSTLIPGPAGAPEAPPHATPAVIIPHRLDSTKIIPIEDDDADNNRLDRDDDNELK